MGGGFYRAKLRTGGGVRNGLASWEQMQTNTRIRTLSSTHSHFSHARTQQTPKQHARAKQRAPDKLKCMNKGLMVNSLTCSRKQNGIKHKHIQSDGGNHAANRRNTQTREGFEGLQQQARLLFARVARLLVPAQPKAVKSSS